MSLCHYVSLCLIMFKIWRYLKCSLCFLARFAKFTDSAERPWSVWKSVRPEFGKAQEITGDHRSLAVKIWTQSIQFHRPRLCFLRRAHLQLYTAFSLHQGGSPHHSFTFLLFLTCNYSASAITFGNYTFDISLLAWHNILYFFGRVAVVAFCPGNSTLSAPYFPFSKIRMALKVLPHIQARLEQILAADPWDQCFGNSEGKCSLSRCCGLAPFAALCLFTFTSLPPCSDPAKEITKYQSEQIINSHRGVYPEVCIYILQMSPKKKGHRSNRSRSFLVRRPAYAPSSGVYLQINCWWACSTIWSRAEVYVLIFFDIQADVLRYQVRVF